MERIYWFVFVNRTKIVGLGRFMYILVKDGTCSVGR